MKTLIKVVIVLLFSNYGFSQIYYSHYLDESSEWRDYSVSFTGGVQEMFRTQYFDGTEDYNGYTYYKKYGIARINGETIFDANFYILYREGNDGNFYAVNPSTGLEQIDFQNGLITNAQVGDAFSDFPSHNDDTCNVSSINIISTIIGLNLKQLIGVFDTSTGIAEGIGEVGPTCLPTLDGGGGLSCYNKQGQTIQFSNIDCSLFPMPLRQNLNTPQLHNINVQVYPNPTTTSIYFDNTNANYTTVAVYNIIGQEMQQQELNFSNKEQINFANFETGIYFLKFNNNKNNNTIVKVVKE